MPARLLRWFVSGVLFMGLTTTPLVAVVVDSAHGQCEGPRHDCAKAVLTDCCSQPQPAATTALSVFVETWSSVTKLYWNSASWIAGAVLTRQPVDTAFAIGVLGGRASSPGLPVDPSESLNVLLI